MNARLLLKGSGWIFVEKPPFVLSVPARDPEDKRPVLGRQLEKQLGQQIYPVHRLDYEVGGLMIFATDPVAHRGLNRIFENRWVTKTYRAISVGGAFNASDEGEWTGRLVRGKKRAFEADHGQETLTRFKCLEAMDGVKMWDLQPITGRSHQLRFDLAKRGSPIWGDRLYGSHEKWPTGIALHAFEINFRRCPEPLVEQLALPWSVRIPTWTFEFVKN